MIRKLPLSCNSLLKVSEQDIIEFNCSAPREMEEGDSSSEDEDCQLPFWNDWLPSSDETLIENFDSSEFPSTDSFANDRKQGNWIPPVEFLENRVKIKGKPKQERNIRDATFEKSVDKNTSKVPYFKDHKSVDQRKETPWQGNVTSRRDWMFAWGGRMELCDITKFNDGDLIWGIVNLGVFGTIKLWVNDYGNVCASADGTLCKLGSTEATVILITEAELLRKMLCLSSAQWVSLCETIQEAKSVLKFDALEEFTFTGKTALEKLWFFICKRRHILPDQCMLVKLSGAVKCMKKFSIALKVVVQEIRNFQGQSVP